MFDVDISSDAGKQIAAEMGADTTLMPLICIYDRGELIFSKPMPLRLYPELEQMFDFYENVVVKDPKYGERSLGEYEKRDIMSKMSHLEGQCSPAQPPSQDKPWFSAALHAP